VDVTIVYPGGVPTFWDLLCGHVRDVVVDVQQVKIPREISTPDNAADPAYRRQLQDWINALWVRKDALVGQLKAGT